MVRIEALSSCRAVGSMSPTLLHRFQVLDAEVVSRVGPGAPGYPTRSPGLTGKRFRGVLVTMLGDQPLAGGEIHALAGKVHGLLASTHQMHLDPARRRHPDRLVPEAAGVEIRRELAVQADEQIHVECGRDAGRIVVRELEDA